MPIFYKIKSPDYEQKLIELRSAIDDDVPHEPYMVKLKLIGHCNLKCAMCHHWKKNSRELLHWEKLERAIRTLSELGTKSFHFTGGEPLLHKNIIPLLKTASSSGARIKITTNGTKIDTKFAHELVMSGVDHFNVSIDSSLAEVHDRLRGVEGSFNKACNGILAIRKVARKHNRKVRINLNYVVNKCNYRGAYRMLELCSDLGIDFFNIIPMDIHASPEIKLSEDEINEYNASIAPSLLRIGLGIGVFRHDYDVYKFGTSPDEIKQAANGHYAVGYYDKHFCALPWIHLAIDFDGRVYPCVKLRNQHSVGNLNDECIESIMRGAKYNSLRLAMKEQKHKVCSTCTQYREENIRLEKALYPLFLPSSSHHDQRILD